MKKHVFIFGAVLGLIVPFIGIFAGLQISTVLGNVLAFPIILVAMLSGTPFGMWHPAMWFVAIIISIAIWTGIAAILDFLAKKLTDT